MFEYKPHVTVTITEEMLRNLGCCENGIVEALPLLPAEISTDPERNFTIAADLCCSPRARLCADAFFLALHTGGEEASPDAEYYRTPHDGYENRFSEDLGLTAQYLAAFADAIARKEGR